MLDVALFALLSATAILGALVMVTRRHPLASALALIVVMIALAGLYALLAAPLVAMVQILVYAGAILVLVTFVIMLLNVRAEDLVHEANAGRRVAVALLCASFLFLGIASAIWRLPGGQFAPLPDNFGKVTQVGMQLFQAYWFPFELVSLLLTVGMVGAVALAKRRLDR